MNFQSKENPNSHLTVKERKVPSLPAKVLYERKLLIGDVLDFGCGLGKDIDFLTEKKIRITGFDPYYKKDYPTKKFDTIMCNYVLNVLLQEEQSSVLMAVSELLKPDGKAYFTVRRDIKRNGFLFNPKREARTYQCNVILPYKSIFRTENCEIYEYQHYTTLNQGKQEISPFLGGNKLRELITESATAFAIFDKYPVNNGHALILPKKLVNDFFELNAHEQTACFIVLKRVKTIIQEKFQTNDFNVSINIGENAGQTVNHVHIHLTPKYTME
jgi:diadenosine tetraphosphate (Ap4A) HIT family hydrolase